MRIFYWLAGLSLLLAWFEPNHYLPWVTFRNDFLAWLWLPFSALALAVENRPCYRVQSVVLFLIVVAAIPLAQFLAGIVFFLGDAVVASSYLVGLAAVVALSAVGDQRTNAERLAWTVLAGAILSACLAIAQWLLTDFSALWVLAIQPGGRAYANLAQPNNLATLLLMGGVSLLYLFDRHLLSRGMVFFIGVLLFAAVAATRSRTGLVAGSLVFAFFWKMHCRHISGQRFNVLSVLFLALLWGCWWFLPALSEVLMIGADASFDRIALGASDARLVIWEQLINAVWDRPFFGWGWNQVSVAQHAVAERFGFSTLTEHSHNIAIDLLVWNGLLLGMLLLSICFFWGVKRLRSLSGQEDIFASSVLLLLGVHALLEFPLDYGFFLVPLGICIGIVERGQQGQQGGGHYTSGRAFLVALGVGVFGVMGWVAYEYQLLEDDWQLLRYESVGYTSRVPGYFAPDVKLLTQLREFLRFARTEAHEGMSDEELIWMGWVVSRYPYPPSMFRYALALALNGRGDEAHKELLKIQKIHPPARYQEAKDGWREAIKRYPQLVAVFPEAFSP